MSTPLATLARETTLHAQPRDKILRLYRFAPRLPPAPAPRALRACAMRVAQPRRRAGPDSGSPPAAAPIAATADLMAWCLASRHVQKQVPYLLGAFGIDEPTANVRANIKQVSVCA